MSRFLQALGIAAIIISALTIYGSLERPGRGVIVEPSALLDAIRGPLADSGLHWRDDVSIEMNGRAVALGFSRQGCDGLMLVAILPHTAQSWAHLAPRLDLSTFRLGYLYQGALYPSVPSLARLAGRLRGDLTPRRTGRLPQVVALAEAGHCDLARSAAAVLVPVSRGRLSLAEVAESKADMGEVRT